MNKNIDIRTKREPITMTSNDIVKQKKKILEDRKLIFVFKESIYKTTQEQSDTSQ